jgi:hypothetical protein
VQLQRNLGLLVISLGAGSMMLTGCARPTASDVQSQAPITTAQESPSPTTAAPQSPQASPTDPVKRDVVYLPTPQVVVEKMLELAKVTDKDLLYDLGSGDGRIPITAAKKYGARGVGVEIDPKLVQESQENAKKAGVADKVKFIQQDLFQTDFKDATVMTLYLLPQLNVKLRPKLFQELKPGTRVVSHDFNMGEWQPEQVVKMDVDGREHLVYVWRIPEKGSVNLR